MSRISLRTGFEESLELRVPESSALMRYFGVLSQLGIRGLPNAATVELRLDQPALKQAWLQLTTDVGVPLGRNGDAARIPSGASGWVAVLVPEDRSLFCADYRGDALAIAPGEHWLQVGWTAIVERPVDGNDVELGFRPATGVTYTTSVPFRKDDPAGLPTFAVALDRALSAFTIPGTIDDLRALPVGAVATAEGRGRLGLAGAFGFRVDANPLVAPGDDGRPEPLAVRSGAMLRVTTGLTIHGRYQLRVRKSAADTVEVGFYRTPQDEWSITTDLGAHATPGGASGLVGDFVAALAPDGAGGAPECLRRAGLDDARADELGRALVQGIDRKLEFALGVELSDSRAPEPAFVFEVRLDELDDAGRAAVGGLLRGDLDGIVAPGAIVPKGIAVRRSAIAHLCERPVVLRAHLLGLLGGGDVLDFLAQSGVLVEPVTGDWLFAAEGIIAELRNATTNPAHLSRLVRELLAQAFLVSCAVRVGSRRADDPEIPLTHVHFAQNCDTNRQDVKDDFELAEALGLSDLTMCEHVLGTRKDYGSTLLLVEARYTDEQTRQMFLEDGAPRPLEQFEAIARAVMARLVAPGAPDNYRRGPFVNDRLWALMNRTGPFNFRLLDEFRPLGDAQMARVRADHALVSWWSRGMHRLAVAVADLAGWAGAHAFDASPDDPERARRREALLAAARRIGAAGAAVPFGDPFGVVAMFRAAGAAADLRVVVAGQRFSVELSR